ncbi:ACP S-malonyltransferase [Thiomicrospira microaerophila]|uniref:ACP S-malonyltransferase n=1 Tax=Thiomicrospira microaerophila TaxID=406020 RepID=UPI00200E6458|nr:ACP S-malonyltransferase [Thiomicrospira microaerophila]UQB42779.1 ACP S-malonyltransferase [Thiomicrospira microaerophila]
MKTAFIFPGQGSQSVGMLSDLAQSYGVVNEVFSEASSVLDYDLWQIVQQGPESQLNQTFVTQPAMLAAGIAVFRTLQQVQPDLKPSFLAGHSLGEYTALVASGVMSLSQGIELVAERGRLMQQAVPAGEGAMAAVLGLEDQQVIELCELAAQDQVVEAVNFNSPGQVVIAGNQAAVGRAMQLAEEKGAKKVVPLAVSVPSHCALMKPAADLLASKLAGMTFSQPQVAVLHNVAVQVYDDAESIKAALVEQLYRPVQWVKTIEYMKATGVEKLLELGPGKVLAGLNRRIDRRMAIDSIFDTATLSNLIKED